jgi:3-phenylpropionate/trans-cinnamate dioxygenase ferredoxin reductase subunit
MTSDTGVVIVGASLTGATAATALREGGYPSPITMVGDETFLPYERPPLSKAFLQGKVEQDALFVHPAEWYESNDVQLQLGTSAIRISSVDHTVDLSSGEQLGYRSLLLATGSTQRRLQVAGAGLSGVHYLRRIGDSMALRSAITTARHAVVVGGGWIGLETAAAMREASVDVTVIEPAEQPLLGVLGAEAAQVFAQLHRDKGVDLRTRTGVNEILGADGRVSAVALDNGDEVPADIVIIGIGATPNTDLAESAGLEVENGVLTDEYLRTSDPDIYAAGDIANAFHPLFGERIRVEHWANARKQGKAVAQTILGQGAPYEAVPYFFTDQYELGMEYTGYVDRKGYDDVVFRGDRSAGEFMVFWLRQGAVLAGMGVNIWDQMPTVAELIRQGRTAGVTVSRDALADPGIPLASLV